MRSVFLTGDLNGNGKIGVQDAQLVTNIIGKKDKFTLGQYGNCCADANGDGQITAADASAIRDYSKGIKNLNDKNVGMRCSSSTTVNNRIPISRNNSAIRKPPVKYGDGVCDSVESNTCRIDCEPSPQCSDTDSGRNYYVKGATNSKGITHTDRCLSKNTLLEYHCKFGESSETKVPCPSGCKNGACFSVTRPAAVCGDGKCGHGEALSCPRTARRNQN